MNQKDQHKLTCPLCKMEKFDHEKGRLDSQWGMTEHKVDMYICQNCKYVLLFAKGRTWWVVE